MISFLPHPTGAEKGVEVQQRLFIPVLLHNCASAELLLLPAASSPQEAGKEAGKKRYVTCSGLQTHGRGGRGTCRSRQRLHIPAIPCTPFSRGEAAASRADHPAQGTTCFPFIPLPSSMHRHTLEMFLAPVPRGFKVPGNHAHHIH